MFNKTVDICKEGFTDLIGQMSVINGNVFFDTIVKIDGKVNGNLIVPQPHSVGKPPMTGVIVSSSATVAVDTIDAEYITIAGHVHKTDENSELNITASKLMVILPGATINNANIFYKLLEIRNGAQLFNCKLTQIVEPS